jgi:hypothetical protein
MDNGNCNEYMMHCGSTTEVTVGLSKTNKKVFGIVECSECGRYNILDKATKSCSECRTGQYANRQCNECELKSFGVILEDGTE